MVTGTEYAARNPGRSGDGAGDGDPTATRAPGIVWVASRTARTRCLAIQSAAAGSPVTRSRRCDRIVPASSATRTGTIVRSPRASSMAITSRPVSPVAVTTTSRRACSTTTRTSRFSDRAESAPHAPCTATTPRCAGASRRRAGEACMPPSVAAAATTVGIMPSGNRRSPRRADGLRKRRRLDRRDLAEDQFFRVVRIDVGQNVIARPDVAAQERFGELVFDHPLNRAPQRACAELRIPSFARKELLGGVGHLELHLLGADLAHHFFEFQADDLLDLLAVELMEDDHLVHTVEELGPEGLLDLFEHLVLHPLVRALIVVARILLRAEPDVARRLDVGRPDVARHDDDRIFEVNLATLRVGEAPVLEYL